MDSCSKNSQQQAGQAMVEFAFMLIIILGLCAGMLQISNLLNYDFWAQQDARYTAFEQVWFVDSSVNVSNDDYFRRPKSVRRLDTQDDVTDEGSTTTLLSIARLNSPNSGGGAIKTLGESSIVVAKNSSRDSIWHRSTKDWYAGVSEKLSFVSNAYASIRSLARRDSNGDGFPSEYEPPTPIVDDVWHEDSLATGIRTVLESAQFGEDFCANSASIARRHGYPGTARAFESPDCAPKYNKDFALHLAENVDFRELFRDYEYQVDWGLSKTEALDTALSAEVGNQFYSFFDTSVSLARIAAVPTITAEKGLIALEVTDPSILRMGTDLRYAGSLAAIPALTVAQFANIFGVNPLGRDPVAEKNLADQVFGVLLADATDAGFLLNSIIYAPVPPTFLGTVGAFQNAAMDNLLRGGQNDLGEFLGDPDGDETDLIGPLIDDSNKEATVVYEGSKGIVPAAARRFSADANLTSRFFLVTQPWHITRRESPTGPFRRLGDQFDGIGEDTEEAVLRRRVAGLWFFPCNAGAFFEAPAQVAGLGGLSGVFNVTEGVSGVLCNTKNFLFINNPVAQLFDFLSQIPLIGGLVPTFPKFPTVRPTAYPGSTEMRGQSFVDDDQMSGEVRNFEDYVTEQRRNNPAPNPKFDNDNFS